MGLFIRGHSKLLQPSWPTLLFEDGFGTGTYIAGTVPQAQLPQVSLCFWTSQGMEVWEAMISDIIKLNESRSKGLGISGPLFGSGSLQKPSGYTAVPG